jgi:hypothetical protein
VVAPQRAPYLDRIDLAADWRLRLSAPRSAEITTVWQPTSACGRNSARLSAVTASVGQPQAADWRPRLSAPLCRDLIGLAADWRPRLSAPPCPDHIGLAAER